MSEDLFLLLEQTLSFVLFALNTTHTFTFYFSVALNTLDTFTFFLQAVSKYLVFSGNFRCASLTLVRLVTPVHCLQLASIVIDISQPRLYCTTHRDPASHNCGQNS